MSSCNRDGVGSEKGSLSLYTFLRLLIAVEDVLLRGRDRAEQSHAFWKNGK